MDVTLPPLAEGADSGTVVSILVSEGDAVEQDQTIIELENEKAIAPIPSTGAGTVSKIHVQEGDTVAVGQPIISIGEGGGAAQEAAPAQEQPAPQQPQPTPQPQAQPQQPAQPAQPAQPQAHQPAAPAAPPAGQFDYQYESKSGYGPPAAPSIRKLARDIGLDLSRVKGSERGGRITLEDIRRHVEQLQQVAFYTEPQPAPAPAPAAAPAPAKKQPEPLDFSKWGEVERKPYSATRKTIGQRMTENWSDIPHVYQFDEADITDLMALRKKYKAAYTKKEASLTLTALAVKAVCNALEQFPVFNASLDLATNEVVYKKFTHIGIAVDTETGLVVPVLRDAAKKSLLEIAKELQEMAQKARDRKLTGEDMKGSSFTISNLGGIGGTHFTPIINAPDVAILGMGRGVTRPAITNGKTEARIMLPLCVSYDHRVIDGADGARFVTALVKEFEKFDENQIKLSES